MPLSEPQRLIKAQSARNLGSKVAFNYDDLRRQCDEYIAQTREQGRALVAEAEARANDVRQQAFEAGRAAGERAGFESAKSQIEARAIELARALCQEQLRTVLPAFSAAAAALAAERDRWLAAWEQAAIRLSGAIAERILRRELARRPEIAGDIIGEALQLAAGMPRLALRLHPEDLAQLRECGHEVIERLSAAAEATLVADESITRGGCLIETRHGVVDARLESQIERIVQELAGEE